MTKPLSSSTQLKPGCLLLFLSPFVFVGLLLLVNHLLAPLLDGRAKSIEWGSVFGGIFCLVISGIAYWAITKQSRDHEAARKAILGIEPIIPGERVLKPDSTPMGKLVALILMMLFWNGVVGVFLYQDYEMFLRGEAMAWFLAIFMIPFLLVGLFLMGLVAHAFLGLFNPLPVVTVSAPVLRLGGSLDLEWKIKGSVSRISRLTIAFEGREEATYQSGKNTVTDKNVFHSFVVVEKTVQQEMGSGRAMIRIPADMMHTFKAPSNTIKWWLKVAGEIRNWPDIESEYEIPVLPAEMKASSWK
ncbi:MAG: hypothetical protein AAB229_10605 [Candidatus Hydrogenedentota bacterium]